MLPRCARGTLMILISKLKAFAIHLIDGVVSVSVIVSQMILFLFLIIIILGQSFMAHGYPWEAFQFFMGTVLFLAMNSLALMFAKISLCLAPGETSKN